MKPTSLFITSPFFQKMPTKLYSTNLIIKARNGSRVSNFGYRKGTRKVSEKMKKKYENSFLAVPKYPGLLGSN